MSCGPINSSRPRTKESPPQNIPLLMFAVLFMVFMLAVTMVFPRMTQALLILIILVRHTKVNPAIHPREA